MSGKDLPTQSSTSRQTSGEVSRDRLSRRCVGHASRKPFLTSSFPMQTTTSGKPRLLSRCHVLRRESLPRQALSCSLLGNHFADTILKAREKHLKRLAASYGRRKVEAEVAVATTDGNEDGRNGGELRTAT
uniref:Uncharacterized protein n=1 Tax=Cucumis melo TaxID=3656 RepID=A0A9I9ELE1_CUCME